ncbi:MAG: hypothetical protein WCC10_03980 [Tumebacillaceae bacterium]
METWDLHRLPDDFVRYVYQGCVELGDRLTTEPDIARQIEEVIREQMARSPIELQDVENGLRILCGSEVSKAVTGCLRFLESYEEVEDLRGTGLGDNVIRLLRYLTARYGPVLKSNRRRINHPLGWHKFGHAVVKLETGSTHLHVKIQRNDDEMLVLEDDTESFVRLINLIMKAMEQTDEYQSMDEATLQEFITNADVLMKKTTEHGLLRNDHGQH